LWLKLPAVTDAGLCALPKLPRLKELYLHMPVGDAGISHLTSGGRLERVVTTSAQFGDAGLAAIIKNPALWGYLDLSSSSVTDDGLKHLAGMNGLGTIDLESTQITDAGLVHLANVTSLMRLLLGKTKVTGAGLPGLRSLEHLHEIDLSDCPVTEEGLAALQAIPGLRTLKLAGTPINNESCGRIPKLPKLQQLDLSRTQLDDACVPALMPTTIGEICLDDTALTDAGLRAIAEDEGDLSELSVLRTKITAKGVLDFYDRLTARGHTCQLMHDIPTEEVNALEEARMASQAAEPQPAESQSNPE
jgi:hypothetical protein